MKEKSAKRHLIITCEHGGFAVPSEFQNLFHKQETVLKSHRGYDIGALELAELLASTFSSPFYFSIISRLLVDLNRSLSSHSLFSEFTTPLSLEQKANILMTHYYPYRSKVEQHIQAQIKKNRPVLHLSIHTFTPVLNKQERHCDIGLLYDPQRPQEKKFCKQWQSLLNEKWKVRLNYPYKGTSDGLTSSLRSTYTDKQYIGIELEVNQKFPLTQKMQWREILAFLPKSLRECLKNPC